MGTLTIEAQARMSVPTFSDRLLRKLAGAQNVVAFTGAGISAESGIPTFRGEDGLWKKFKPEELANFDAFIRNPDLVWEWYRHRKSIISSIQPNAGHCALVEMENFHSRFTIITQNIDNLHRRAGSKTIHELHGNIERNYCIGCGKYFSEDEITVSVEAPRCARCRGLIRPDVVWFGESLPIDAWKASVDAAESAEVFLVIGTSAIVYPAASLPQIARRAGAFVLEINIEPTELSDSTDESLIGKAGEILPELFLTYHALFIHQSQA